MCLGGHAALRALADHYNSLLNGAQLIHKRVNLYREKSEAAFTEVELQGLRSADGFF